MATGIVTERLIRLRLGTLVASPTFRHPLTLAKEIVTLDDMRDAARRIMEMGARAVLIKGGHRDADSTDLLWDGAATHEFPAPRIRTQWA